MTDEPADIQDNDYVYVQSSQEQPTCHWKKKDQENGDDADSNYFSFI